MWSEPLSLFGTLVKERVRHFLSVSLVTKGVLMRFRVLTAAAVLAFGVAACGGSDDTSTPADSGATAVTVEAGDLFFSPDALNVSAEGVAITLDNIGLVEHNLVIDEVDLEIYVDVGETVTETVVLPAGTYEFYCSIPGHREGGMVGVITAA